MHGFVQKHGIVIGHTVIAAFILTTAITLNATGTSLYFYPQGSATLYPDEIRALDVNITTAVPINAIDTIVSFPPDLIEIVGEGKQDSFLDLWPHEEMHPPADGLQELHFAGGTIQKGGLMGTGTALTLSIRALKPGTAEITFKDPLVVASDGKGTAVPVGTQPFSFTIIDRTVALPAGGSAAASAPSPDFDGDGSITLIDTSIFLVKMFFPYDPRNDLNSDGSVGVADFSVLLSRFKM